MLERIVVPLDGSLTAEAVLPFVRRFLHRTDSEIILVRAVIPAPVENAIMIADAALGAARAYVKEVQERLDREGVRVKSAVHVGSAIGIILDTVDEERATMIAMATHGATGLKRILMGSVAEAVLRKSPVPVFVVRPFWTAEGAVPDDLETRPVRNILLPVDGSDLAELAVPPALEVADLFEARVVLLRVVEPRKNADEEAHGIEEAREHLQGISREFERKGVRTHTLVEKGEPVDEILKTLRFHDADLAVMTTHGRSGLSRLVTGSVTEQVLRRAPVPLLVVRAAKPARARRRRAAVSRKR
jgi:nucleotide-binding universal stress UspA family protein